MCVRGAPDVIDNLPDRDAVISVRDFSSMEALAEYVKQAMHNETLYARHLAWKTKKFAPRFSAEMIDKGRSKMYCTLCDHIAGSSPPISDVRNGASKRVSTDSTAQVGADSQPAAKNVPAIKDVPATKDAPSKAQQCVSASFDGSLGIRLAEADGAVVATQVVAGGAADKQGVQAGMRIESLQDISLESLKDALRSIKATPKPLRGTFCRMVDAGGVRFEAGSGDDTCEKHCDVTVDPVVLEQLARKLEQQADALEAEVATLEAEAACEVAIEAGAADVKSEVAVCEARWPDGSSNKVYCVPAFFSIPEAKLSGNIARMPGDGCKRAAGFKPGTIAVAILGRCSTSVKAHNAALSGAAALLVVDPRQQWEGLQERVEVDDASLAFEIHKANISPQQATTLGLTVSGVTTSSGYHIAVTELPVQNDGTPGPAAAAGLLVGDRVVAVNGSPIGATTKVASVLRTLEKSKSPLNIKVERSVSEIQEKKQLHCQNLRGNTSNAVASIPVVSVPSKVVQDLQLLQNEEIVLDISFDAQQFSGLTTGREKPLFQLNKVFTSRRADCGSFTGKAHLVTYASESYWDRSQTYVKEAEATGFFESVRVYTPEMLDDAGFYTAVDISGNEHMHFTWKPWVISLALESLPVGDVLVYLDVGCTVNPHGRGRFLEYLNTVACDDGIGVMGFQIEGQNTDRKYTKGDVLEYMGVHQNSSVLDSSQIAGGLVVAHHRDEARSLMRQWRSLTDTAFLWDESKSQIPNAASFIAHRHDQSLFSILMKTNGGIAIPDETYPPGSRLVPFWTTRTATGCRSVEEAWACT
jgi:membrane-associated protease RseP (regulator of RpoE activity)